MADLITRMEELVLLAVAARPETAYRVGVQQNLEQAVGLGYSQGAVYVPLERLAARGYLRSWMSQPTSTRGGRRKKLYALTPAGERALDEVRWIHEALWRSLTTAGGAATRER